MTKSIHITPLSGVAIQMPLENKENNAFSGVEAKNCHAVSSMNHAFEYLCTKLCNIQKLMLSYSFLVNLGLAIDIV